MCHLVPIPTNILEASLDILIKPTTTIINISLASGTFPLSFKKAHVIHFLRKSNLLVNNLKNYRPVPNLSFLFKIIEKVVSNRLQAHINSNKPTILYSLHTETAAFHARVRGSVPGLGGLKKTKNVSSPSTCETQYCGEPP